MLPELRGMMFMLDPVSQQDACPKPCKVQNITPECKSTRCSLELTGIFICLFILHSSTLLNAKQNPIYAY